MKQSIQLMALGCLFMFGQQEAGAQVQRSCGQEALENALTHGEAGTPVRVSASERDGHLEICVANAGKPIPREQMDVLFLPFRRGGGSGGAEGLGLGLFIASQIAQAHGGTLEVTSDERQTCFTFRMPVPAA